MICTCYGLCCGSAAIATNLDSLNSPANSRRDLPLHEPETKVRGAYAPKCFHTFVLLPYRLEISKGLEAKRHVSALELNQSSVREFSDDMHVCICDIENGPNNVCPSSSPTTNGRLVIWQHSQGSPNGSGVCNVCPASSSYALNEARSDLPLIQCISFLCALHSISKERHWHTFFMSLIVV